MFLRWPTIVEGNTIMTRQRYAISVSLWASLLKSCTFFAVSTVLVLHWYCTSTVLVLYWYCIGTVPELYWYCTGTVLYQTNSACGDDRTWTWCSEDQTWTGISDDALDVVAEDQTCTW